MSDGPLSSVRVLDFSAMVAGPYCSRLLADAGAEVIKVEPPEGDYIRTREPMRSGRSAYFGVLNAGKQSIALNLKRPDAVALARELAARSDVVVENFRPGVMRRLGLGYDVLASVNSRLVYCAISGYGQAGAHAGRPSYAAIVQAESGYDAASMSYQPDPDRPLNSGVFVGDYLTGVHAFGAICAALVRRARTGQGEFIDCALMDAMVGMLAYEVAEAQSPVSKPRFPYRPTRAKDGYLMLAPISQASFEAMVRAAGRADLATDPRFAMPVPRAANLGALMDEMDRWAADKTVAECAAAMTDGGVPCARYQTVAEVMASSYAAERGLFAAVQDGATQLRATNPPFKMHGAGTAGRVPGLGESGPEVIGRVLGRTVAEVEKLMAEGVLCRPS